MGIDQVGLDFISYAAAKGVDFDSVLTFGRQGFHCPPSMLQDFLKDRKLNHLLGQEAALTKSGYFEDFFKIALGSKVTDSMDVSSYEHATVLHDMNTPLEPKRQYSCLLDYGTLEHVFNVPVFLQNAMRLVKTGGHILHVLPANNQVGHGFYQFSPELFFSLYTPDRGFEIKAVFLAMYQEPGIWREVRSPLEVKRRVELSNTSHTSILVLAQKKAEVDINLQTNPPQQSDYSDLSWKGLEEDKNAKNLLGKIRKATSDLVPAEVRGLMLRWLPATLACPPISPDLIPRRIKDLVK